MSEEGSIRVKDANDRRHRTARSVGRCRSIRGTRSVFAIKSRALAFALVWRDSVRVPAKPMRIAGLLEEGEGGQRQSRRPPACRLLKGSCFGVSARCRWSDPSCHLLRCLRWRSTSCEFPANGRTTGRRRDARYTHSSLHSRSSPNVWIAGPRPQWHVRSPAPIRHSPCIRRQECHRAWSVFSPATTRAICARRSAAADPVGSVRMRADRNVERPLSSPDAGADPPAPHVPAESRPDPRERG